ncbi:MAG: hypothetical protein ACTTI3_09195 [Treponema sp.]
MNSILQLKEYTIPKLMVNFENIKGSEIEVEINTSINIMIPKAEKDTSCGVGIKTEAKYNNQQILVSAELKARAEFTNTDYSHDVNRKRDQIAKELIPDLYSKLRDCICILLEKANIDYITFPSYKELQP